MRRVRGIGRLAKVSHWIAHDLSWVVALSARAGSTSRLLDFEGRLALGLEAYGEVLRGGDAARVDDVLRELETGHFALGRLKTPYEYSDPVERLETRRRMNRRARALRRKVDRMTAEGVGGRALRDAKHELSVYEDVDT